MSGHGIKVAVESDTGFFAEARRFARELDGGWRPAEPVVRLYFDDLPALLRCLTPKRFELLTRLRTRGHSSISALARDLGRQYRNVYDDVKTLERLGLITKDAGGRVFVAWDELDATFRLVA